MYSIFWLLVVFSATVKMRMPACVVAAIASLAFSSNPYPHKQDMGPPPVTSNFGPPGSKFKAGPGRGYP